MAFLSKTDLLKRNNIELFCDRCITGEFQLGFFGTDGSIKVDNCTIQEKERVEILRIDLDNKFECGSLLREACLCSGYYPRIFLKDSFHKVYLLTDIYKDHEFAGKNSPPVSDSFKLDAERQERALVDAINFYCKEAPIAIHGLSYHTC